jgi:hypothetical protein
VERDYAETAKWWRKAADQGDISAQANLGTMYRKGQGVLQDYTEAAKWYRMAAEQGLASAQYNLGLMYGPGKGVEQDYVQAYMWLNLAASQGIKNATEVLDFVAGKMTLEQIAQAKKLAREWKPK